MEWDFSMRMKIVPDFSDAFASFALMSEVSHFPNPSDIPVLRRIVSGRVLIKTPMAQKSGHQ